MRVLSLGLVDDPQTRAKWRDAGMRAEFVHFDAFFDHIRLDAGLIVDAIVCRANADDSPAVLLDRLPSYNIVVNLLDRLRSSPPELSMPDGRKWSALPFVMFHEGGTLASYLHEHRGDINSSRYC